MADVNGSSKPTEEDDVSSILILTIFKKNACKEYHNLSFIKLHIMLHGWKCFYEIFGNVFVVAISRKYMAIIQLIK